MKKITFLLLLFCSISFGQNLYNPAIIGQTNRNQKVGKGFQIEDTLLTKGKVIFSNLVTYGSLDTIIGIKGGLVVKGLSSGGGGTSSLFPNGIEMVTSSRDFQASDEGKLLVLINASLTMPVGVSILDNKQLGVLALFNSSTIEVSPNSELTLYSPNTGQSGEILLLENTIQEGQSKLAPISSFNINGKTALKHLMDNMGSNSLFPNGIDFVTTSRDFQSSDAGKRLFISGDSTVLSMPEVSPFIDGDIVGIIPDNVDASFTTEFGGSLIYPLKNGDGGPSECVVLIATEINSTIKLFPISTSIILDVNDNKLKTAIRYFYDNCGGIPLSGTTIGNPVTGDIDINEMVSIKNGFRTIKFTDENSIALAVEDTVSTSRGSINLGLAAVGILVNDGANQADLNFITEYFKYTSDNPESRGFSGQQDYTANITDLDYTQKIYVGFRGTATLSSGTVTVTTDKIKTGYKIYLSVNTPSGTQGFLSAPTGSIVDETEFVINSTSATDDSIVNWWIAP